jgi:hypothetical protein
MAEKKNRLNLEQLSALALRRLIDEQAVRDFGSQVQASFEVLLALGLIDGDLAAEGAPPSTPIDQIRANVAKALALKDQGLSTHRILMEGDF